MVRLDNKAVRASDLPDPADPGFTDLLVGYFEAGLLLVNSLQRWREHGTKHKGSVQILDLPDKAAFASVREQLDLSQDYWCARSSIHTITQSSAGPAGSGGASLYDLFKEGLFIDHSLHEKEYIESCQSADLLESYQAGTAEAWRMAYKTPAPSTDRTFVILFLCRELESDAEGKRSFINVTIPLDHPACAEKQGTETSRVRGRYVSVEHVQEVDEGTVIWNMATSSDAGGSILQFITNASLPGAIAEDVPSFLQWLEKRHCLKGGSIATALPGTRTT